MFCKHCGTQIPDGSEKCPSCGGDLTNKAASQTALNGSSVKEIADSVTSIAAEKTAGLPLTLIAKVCILVALVAFFLPFVSVSCTQEKSMTESYSGFRLMLNIDKDDDKLTEQSDKDQKANIFLLLAFAGGVATAVFLFYKKNLKLASMISGASALLLLLFRITFRSYYGFSDIPDNYAKYLDVDTKFGLVLCILMMLATAAACFLERKNTGSDTGGATSTA